MIHRRCFIAQVRRSVCGGWTFAFAVLTVLAGCSDSSPPTAPAPPGVIESKGGKLIAGMNLAPLTHRAREWAFVDVFKMSRPWFSQNVGGGEPWDTKQPIRETEDGWPLLEEGQAAATIMCAGTEGHYPAGRYVCTYKGTGKLFIGFDARMADEKPGRIELDVKPGRGIYLRIDASDAGDPIRDIHIWMPGFEPAGDVAASAFHPLFVERLRPFDIIRFMDWQRTNTTEMQKWSDRTRPDSARQTGTNGVAIEHMIDLCNEVGADPWFCMPHLADDDCVKQFAELVLLRLDRARRVYVEYSNEVWNARFPQGAAVKARATATGAPVPKVVAEEAKRDFAIWREVFGGEAHRVVRVAGCQHHGMWHTEKLLESMAGEFDIVAVAAYFEPSAEDIKSFNSTTTAQDVLSACLNDVHARPLVQLKAMRDLAQSWSQKLGRPIPLFTYEGGPHLWVRAGAGPAPPYLNAYVTAQSHPAMGEVYRTLLNGFIDLGGTGFVAFNYVDAWDKAGTFGHLEFQDQSLLDAVKYNALVGVSQKQTASP